MRINRQSGVLQGQLTDQAVANQNKYYGVSSFIQDSGIEGSQNVGRNLEYMKGRDAAQTQLEYELMGAQADSVGRGMASRFDQLVQSQEQSTLQALMAPVPFDTGGAAQASIEGQKAFPFVPEVGQIAEAGAAAKAEAERAAADTQENVEAARIEAVQKTAARAAGKAAEGQAPAAGVPANQQPAPAQQPAAVTNQAPSAGGQPAPEPAPAINEYDKVYKTIDNLRNFDPNILHGINSGAALGEALNDTPFKLPQEGQSKTMRRLNVLDLSAIDFKAEAGLLKAAGEQIKGGAPREEVQERFNRELEALAKGGIISAADLHAAFDGNYLAKAMAVSLGKLGTEGISVFDAMPVENTQNTINALIPALTPQRSYERPRPTASRICIT